MIKKSKVDAKERYYSTIKQRIAKPEDIRYEIEKIKKCLLNPRYENSPEYLCVLIKNASKMKQEMEVKKLLSHDDVIKEVYGNTIKELETILKTATDKLQTLPDSHTYANEIKSSVS
jgi:nitrate reductase assembly molybdenum cofactor insertion protein NarJ